MQRLEEHLLKELDTFTAFARRRVSDPHLAADVVQESLLKAVKSADQLRDDESITAWFYRILRRTIIDLYRRRASPHNAASRPITCACAITVPGSNCASALRRPAKSAPNTAVSIAPAGGDPAAMPGGDGDPAGLPQRRRSNAALPTTATRLQPSCWREYVEWITEAKREETRAKRLKTAVEWIAKGKSRNWK